MVALVTGSSRGLGRCIIEAFASLGYDVIINFSADITSALDFEKYIKDKYKVGTYVFKCDVSKEDEVEWLFDELKNSGINIDVLVNNAAIARDNSYLDKSSKEFMEVIGVNLLGTFLVTKYATKIMNRGTIINISSTDATNTYNEISMDYCASKAGVNSLCKTFSRALPNFKVMGVMLPWLNTESVLEMEPNFLKSELEKTGQKELLDKFKVAKKIVELATTNEGIASGSILELGCDYKWI